MKRRLGLILFSLGAAVGAQENVMALPEALRLALQNPNIQAAVAMQEATGAQVAKVKSARWPQVEIEAQARTLGKDPGFKIPRGALGNPVSLSLVTGERDVQSGRLTASYLLWDWGRITAAIDAAKKNEEAATFQAAASRRAILLATLRVFCEAQSAQGTLEATKQAFTTAKETLRIVKAAVDQQVLPQSDSLAAEFYLARREAEVAGAQAHLAGALAALAELTGRTVEGVTPVVVDRVPKISEEGQWTREEVQVLRAQKEAASFLAEAFRREQLPNVALVAGVENIQDHFLLHQNNSFGILALRATIFDGGNIRASVREQELLARSAGFAEEAMRKKVAREVSVAVAKIEASRGQVAAAEKALRAAEEELRLEKLRHEQGLATTRDLLTAQEHLAQAKSALVGAQAQLLAAVGESISASGGDLLAYFGGNHE